MEDCVHAGVQHVTLHAASLPEPLRSVEDGPVERELLQPIVLRGSLPLDRDQVAVFPDGDEGVSVERDVCRRYQLYQALFQLDAASIEASVGDLLDFHQVDVFEWNGVDVGVHVALPAVQDAQAVAVGPLVLVLLGECHDVEGYRPVDLDDARRRADDHVAAVEEEVREVFSGLFPARDDLLGGVLIEPIEVGGREEGGEDLSDLRVRCGFTRHRVNRPFQNAVWVSAVHNVDCRS